MNRGAADARFLVYTNPLNMSKRMTMTIPTYTMAGQYGVGRRVVNFQFSRHNPQDVDFDDD